MRNKLKEINKGVEVEAPSKRDGQPRIGRPAEEAGETADEIPTKSITTSVTVDIKALVKFIDFEGRADAESLEKILSFINPKRLVSKYFQKSFFATNIQK